ADPSTLVRRLRGDLDWIVMKALEKNRTRRYATASALADDVLRHLDDQPVLAGPPGVGYRAAKFCRRHRAAVTTAILVAVVLLLGMVGTAWGWRRAIDERAAAEQRSEQVLDLCHTLVVDLTESIVHLDGALPAREILVTKALEHLERLAEEGGDDHEMLASLATVYDKLGDLHGGTRNPSFGDTRAALRSYEAALAIREVVARDRPDDDDAQRSLALAHMKIGDTLSIGGDVPGAGASYRKAIDIHEARLASRPGDDERLRDVAVAFANVAWMMERTGDTSGALALYEQSLALRNQLAAALSDDRRLRRDLTVAHIRVGFRLLDAGRAAEGMANYDAALRLRTELAEVEPDNGVYQRDLAMTHALIADEYLRQQRPDEALAHVEALLAIVEQRARDNPRSGRAALDLAMAHEVAGRTAAMLGDEDAAARSFDLLRTTVLPLVGKTSNRRVRDLAASSHRHRSDSRAADGDLEGALESARQALQIVEEQAATDPSDVVVRAVYLRAVTRVGRLELDLGRPDDAWGAVDTAVAGFDELRQDQPTSLDLREGHAAALHQLARVAARLGDSPRALEFASRAVDMAPRPGAEMLGDLARMQFETGDRAAALASVRRALERLGDKPGARATELRRSLQEDERRYRE
ncbi:MAG: tetratricopeptide repeat protein, partial [Planctomycetota bacterium]